jgi:uncharacterized repeat protein (TIGR02543 family)
MTGYTFKGWYTKALGGKKISTTTKATVKTTYYAQFKRTLSSTEKKLVGTWGVYSDGSTVHKFNADGTYIRYIYSSYSSDWRYRGYWSIKNNVLTTTEQSSMAVRKDTSGSFEEWGIYWSAWSKWNSTKNSIQFGTCGSDSKFEGTAYSDIVPDGWVFDKILHRFIKDRVGAGVKGM